MLERSALSPTGQSSFKDFINEWLTGIAFQIANDATRSDIECYCAIHMASGDEQRRTEAHADCWYDSANIPDPEMKKTIEVAIIYLAARGLLKRHAQNSRWLRPLGAKKDTSERKISE